MSFERILPFLRPIEHVLQDDEVTDIMVHGDRGVFVDRGHCMRQEPGLMVTERFLRVAVISIARSLGNDVSEDYPILDARLPDGSRVSAILPPCSVEGTTLTIRKFHSHRLSAEDMVRLGTFPEHLLNYFRTAITRGKNMLIGGGTGSGKTTLLNALLSFVPNHERIFILEDTAEIHCDKPNRRRLETRPAQPPHLPAIKMTELLQATLRHRPDRIIVGEVRGAEAFDLMEALNTGHSGTLSTIHANAAGLVLSRLTTCILKAGIEMPYKAIRSNIAENLQVIIHVRRNHNGERHVSEVLEMEGYDLGADRYEFTPIYRREEDDLERAKARSVA